MTHVWLEYPDTGGKQQFPEPAAEAWRARGWVNCDPPPEPDLLHDPADESGGDVVEAEIEAAEAAESAVEPGDEPDAVAGDATSTRSRRKRGDGAEEA